VEVSWKMATCKTENEMEGGGKLDLREIPWTLEVDGTE